MKIEEVRKLAGLTEAVGQREVSVKMPAALLIMAGGTSYAPVGAACDMVRHFGYKHMQFTALKLSEEITEALGLFEHALMVHSSFNDADKNALKNRLEKAGADKVHDEFYNIED